MTRHVYQFGPFELDVLTKRLFRDEEPIALAPKAFDLLLLLVAERGRLVEKSELMQRLWPTTFVEEANLTQHVFTLRRALGDQPDGRPYIDTVPRRGYLFAADVNEIVETGYSGAYCSRIVHGALLRPSAPLRADTGADADLECAPSYLLLIRPTGWR
jgi:DNA-binding winged helix-turn-helix (wHTH) protein